MGKENCIQVNCPTSPEELDNTKWWTTRRYRVTSGDSQDTTEEQGGEMGADLLEKDSRFTEIKKWEIEM